MPNWYVLHLKANHENVAEKYLNGTRIEHFLPRYSVKSRRKDRKHALVNRPLFPGYVFVRLNLQSEQKTRALRSPGAVKLVGFNTSSASVVPDDVVESLKILVKDGSAVKPHPYLDAGRRVNIMDGPFKGASGFLDRRGRKNRLVVTLELLGRSVSVPVEEEDVELAD